MEICKPEIPRGVDLQEAGRLLCIGRTEATVHNMEKNRLSVCQEGPGYSVSSVECLSEGHEKLKGLPSSHPTAINEKHRLKAGFRAILYGPIISNLKANEKKNNLERNILPHT